MRVSGFTSTGSKRPLSLFGGASDDLPHRMTRSDGSRVWDEHDREYLDFISALGAVGLGYGHSHVIRAAADAMERGGIGPLAPVDEERLAEELAVIMPVLDEVRFLKTGAEAVAAAVRLARTATGRDRVLGCGYHGWLDWSQGAAGVPSATRALYSELPFNDADRARELIRSAGDRLAAVVFEPVIVAEPEAAWLEVLREETTRSGAVLIVDEIKTICRLAVGGAGERYGIRADLTVLGKALANGFPLAAVGGRREVMAAATRTWISSTLATEFVSLAAAQATLQLMVSRRVPAHLRQVGSRLLEGLQRLHLEHPELVTGVGGIPEMCFLHYADDTVSRSVTAACAHSGLLFKRSAYNFVSLAHDGATVDRTLALLAEALSTVAKPA